MTGWQPIETAPRDKTRVLLWCTAGRYHNPFSVTGYFLVEQNCRSWVDTYSGEDLPPPTHWMPLPPPPTEG